MYDARLTNFFSAQFSSTVPRKTFSQFCFPKHQTCGLIPLISPFLDYSHQMKCSVTVELSCCNIKRSKLHRLKTFKNVILVGSYNTGFQHLVHHLSLDDHNLSIFWNSQCYCCLIPVWGKTNDRKLNAFWSVNKYNSNWIHISGFSRVGICEEMIFWWRGGETVQHFQGE